MDKLELYHGDCLEVMKLIPDGSVDMILCDLPYGTIKGMQLKGRNHTRTQWDESIDTNALFPEYERVLRMNGVAILFSQEPYTSHLRTQRYVNFEFCYPLVWVKNHFANVLSSKKAPVSYFEDLSVFVKKYDRQNLHPLRAYVAEIMEFCGLKSSKDVNKILNHRRAEHFFYVESLQFKLCTRQTYEELTHVLELDGMQGFLPYDDLVEINRSFERTFNLPSASKYLGNVLNFKKDYQGLHPTQKPVALLECLINTYTNEDDIVLDNCMGSGSTGVACINTNRNFIGIEKDLRYFKIAKKRIENSKQEHPRCIVEQGELFGGGINENG